MDYRIFLLLIFGMGLGFIIFDSPSVVFGQTSINVTTGGGDPCFLNYTAGAEMWANCGIQQDFIATFLLPFQWVSGGIFSIIVVSVIIIMVYKKYESAIYPLAIGIVMVPISYFAFPDQFLIFAVIMAFLAVGTYIWYILIRQTKEY